MPLLSYKQTFLNDIHSLLPKADMGLIERAYDFAEDAHRGQKRQNGEDFITHPASTALKLAELRMDDTTIVAGLLHDAVEDTDVTHNDIRENFGEDVAFLVRGSTKILSQDRYNSEESQVKTLQRMFLAMAKDIRAVIVKLADRLHNMETLSAKNPESQKRIAQQTMDIFAPIANRLGIGHFRGKLEDLSFQYLQPEEYEWVERYAFKDLEQRKKLVEETQFTVQEMMKNANIKFIATDGRVKYKYSLYKKLLRYDNDISQIFDLVALRVIVPDIATCYEVLGMLHSHFMPLPGRVKDYIAAPKPNGYKSLHTTVQIGRDQVVEFQIRTQEMHEEAEYGIAAYWSYKERQRSSDHKEHVTKKDLEWVSKLSQWKYEIRDSEEYIESLKIDFFKDRIYVRTPRGDVFDLPENAFPLDFAYRVHTEVGHAYNGAKVNGKMVRMNHELENGDVVEILTSKKSEGPKRKWIEYAKTSNARNKIRQWLRKKDPEENIRIGQDILRHHINLLTKLSYGAFMRKLSEDDKEKLYESAHFESVDHFLESLGNGAITFDGWLNRLRNNDPEFYEKLQDLFIAEGFTKEAARSVEAAKKKDRVVVNRDESLGYAIANCCSPKPGDKIMAYMTKKKGITVHKVACRNIRGRDLGSRILHATWRTQLDAERRIGLRITMRKAPGALRDISNEISGLNIGVSDIKAQLADESHAVINLKLSVSEIQEIETISKKLMGLDFVEDVERV